MYTCDLFILADGGGVDETTWQKYLKEKKQRRKEKRSKVKETRLELEESEGEEKEGRTTAVWDLMTRSSSMTSQQQLQ